MKIYDISQEVFSCRVYPGDDKPYMIPVHRMKDGDLYNLTNISMCTHNGTHIDAPFHFISDGNTIEKIPLEYTVGKCFVMSFNGRLTKDDAIKIVTSTCKTDSESSKRILFKGNTLITFEAAELFLKYDIRLIGVESQTVGEKNSLMEIHKILLQQNIVLLEGINLDNVPEGKYFLNAAPLSLAGSDGAPCRAILIEFEDLTLR